MSADRAVRWQREGKTELEASSDPTFQRILEAREREKATNLSEFETTCGREVRCGHVSAM